MNIVPFPALDQDEMVNAEIIGLIMPTLEAIDPRHKKKINQDRRGQKALSRLFEINRKSKSNFQKFTAALAERIGANAHDIRHDTKAVERAAEKLDSGDRTLHDIERARIYISTPEEALRIKSLLTPGRESAAFLKRWANIGYRYHTHDDYLKAPRSSGFSGAINVDIRIGEGDNATIHEIQIMPEQYKEIDKASHKLFGLIRHLEETYGLKAEYEIPNSDKERKTEREEFTTEQIAVKRLLTGLLVANRAMWDIACIDHGFDSLRSDDVGGPTKQQALHAEHIMTYIIDMIGTDDRPYKAEIRAACEAGRLAALSRNVSHAAEEEAQRDAAPDSDATIIELAVERR